MFRTKQVVLNSNSVKHFPQFIYREKYKSDNIKSAASPEFIMINFFTIYIMGRWIHGNKLQGVLVQFNRQALYT